MLEGKSILIVEDDRDTLDLFAGALTKHGAAVRTAQSVPAALDMMPAWKPDIVLCDLHLPDVDGYAFLSRLREITGLGSVPVIAISASHPTVERDKALEAGFALHVTKPCKLSEIVDAIRATV